MAKKKNTKDDGINEDLDKEALELDAEPEAEAKPEGDMSELLEPEGDSLGKPEVGAETAPLDATTPGEPEANSAEGAEGKADADTAAASDSVTDSAASTDGGSDKASEATASSDVSAEAPAQVPVLAEPHPEAQAAVDLDPAVMEAFKEAGNLLTPALHKLGEYSEKIHQLEDEAKNRFAAMRQKATECVAALEAIFMRD